MKNKSNGSELNNKISSPAYVADPMHGARLFGRHCYALTTKAVSVSELNKLNAE